MWKLKDLLVAAGEPPLTAYTTDNDSGDFILLLKQQIPNHVQWGRCYISLNWQNIMVYQNGFQLTSEDASV